MRVSCSCGRTCKSSRGLKVHQAKSKCQIPENKLKALLKKCFMSLQDIILSSCLTFEDHIYFSTSEKNYSFISGENKPVSGNKCYVQTSDIIVNPLTEYLNNDISPCNQASCLTCNIFISDQVFKRNLTGKEYKLSGGSTNVIYEYIALIVVSVMLVKLKGH